jgi:3D (Asp-Asp-Asp) domain-containing protein
MINICKIVTVVAQIAALQLVSLGCSPNLMASLDSGPGPASVIASDNESGISGQLSPTIYFIKLIHLDQQGCDSKKTIFDENQSPIIKVCESAYRLCLIEGTCALVEDQNSLKANDIDALKHKISLINYVKMKNGVPLFSRVDTLKCPYGYGVKAQCLDPYHTLAADLNFHRAGDVIFVPKIVGVKLPNGETHDGYFIIRDKGGAITGKERFDFFTGYLDHRNDENPFSKIKLNDSKTRMPFRKVIGVEADRVRKGRNFPLVPGSQ